MKGSRRRPPSRLAFLAWLTFGVLLVLLVGGYVLERRPTALYDRVGLASYAFAILGAAFGFLLFLLTNARGRLRDFWATSRTLVALLIGALVGAAIGTVAHAAIHRSRVPDADPAAPLIDVPQRLASGEPLLFTIVALGALFGALITAMILGNAVVQRMGRGLGGGFLGGMAGLVMYAFAYTVIHYPEWPGSHLYLLHLGEAVFSTGPLKGLFVAFGATLGFLIAGYSWRFYGVLTLVSLLSVVFGFLGYSFFVTLPLVEAPYRWLALLLFAAEAVSLALVVLYSFYTIDVATRKRWTKGPHTAPYSPYFVPKVAFQVPCYNEPPEMVLESLRRLNAMDYPRDRFLIMVLDDSTREESAGPLREFCREHDLMYIHRTDRRGFKAGALNHSLKYLPPDVDLIAVVDADYQVEPNFLRECVGYFINPDVAWVQTPQDYRNTDQSFLTKQYELADSYFYRTVMPSRNEHNTIIFSGTMGILRKDALVEAGGWGEKYISEDAELSLRLLTEGWQSLYINKTYGRGLIPPTYDGYKKQLYRWSFGGAKILRGHFWDIFMGRLNRRQSFDYFVGSIHWFEGLFIIFVACVLMLLGIADVTGIRIVTHHSREVFLVGLIPFFLLTDSLTRLHMALRESMGLSIGKSIKVLGMWFSVKFSNAFGALKSFVGFNMPFVRTPKAPDLRVGRAEAWARALRVTRFESFMTALLFTTCLLVGLHALRLDAMGEPLHPARAFLVVWLLYYTLVFFAAPFYAYKSYATFRPLGATDPGPYGGPTRQRRPRIRPT